jgi:hypothetical protein
MDIFKFDRSFISGTDTPKENAEIVRSIVDMAHSMASESPPKAWRRRNSLSACNPSTATAPKATCSQNPWLQSRRRRKHDSRRNFGGHPELKSEKKEGLRPLDLNPFIFLAELMGFKPTLLNEGTFKSKRNQTLFLDSKMDFLPVISVRFQHELCFQYPHI